MVFQELYGYDIEGLMIQRRNQSTIKEFYLLGFQTSHSSRIILVSILLVVYVLAFNGNLLIIALVSSTQRLHSPMYLFLSNLSFNDIMLATATVPSALHLSCSDATVVQNALVIIATPETVIETMFIISTYVCIFLAIHRISSTTGRQKALSTCSSHLAVVCLYYGTIIAIYVFPPRSDSLNTNKIVSLLYTVVPPFLNPIIYSLRNHEIKTAIKKIFQKNFMKEIHG
ncbi:olfactory receptor 1J1-like [Pelobates fuscus]|uniref:olfactory receptor 1J1-like n=1 Tax=Pelobates fuscus TaxID=191477 RepID=UPI002FE4D4B3